MGRALIIAVVIVAAALVIAVIIYVAHRAVEGSTARVRDLKTLRQRHRAYQQAVANIRESAERWNDIDSVLATEIKRELHALDVKNQELEDQR